MLSVANLAIFACIANRVMAIFTKFVGIIFAYTK